jgi:HD-GYP domain-containing protein (c-di-GMP phosphodiesterase class II)
VLESEPDPVRLVDDSEVEEIAQTFGDLVDLKSPWLQGHSSAVADLAGRAAGLLGLPDQRVVRIAGHLHDVGRVGVSSRIWDKAGPLTTTERDQARLHSYFTERVLARVPALAEVAALASQHHERSDGSGYHRGVTGSQLSLSSRVLAAADFYRSHVEERPYRTAATATDAAQRLTQEVRAGRLDPDAVAAVLEAAGRGRAQRVRPAGLTERQVEVLRLVARGLSNRDIAMQLVISTRTAEHHVQDVYGRIGSSTRAGAALFAMEHGLLDGSG